VSVDSLSKITFDDGLFKDEADLNGFLRWILLCQAKREDPTVVYESYWRFAAERHSIYLKRLRREPPPWTSDDVLKQYKFTNAFRACDRVSQYLIRDVIYNDNFPTGSEEYVFRMLLFKLFDSIPAWEVLVKNFQVPTWKEFDEKPTQRH
jgi:alpha-glutamyl/putrescinyl thymine pyrophosphorylase clade 1